MADSATTVELCDWAHLNDGLGPVIEDGVPDEDTVIVGAFGVRWHRLAHHR